MIALVLFSPVMLIVMILLQLTGHRRMFFVQQRVGLNDKIFQLVSHLKLLEDREFGETGKFQLYWDGATGLFNEV